MTDLSKATPRPWAVEDATNIVGPAGNDVGQFWGNSTEPGDVAAAECNTALTVRAVNCFDALVAAGREAHEYFKGFAPFGNPITLRLEAALKLAEGDS